MSGAATAAGQSDDPRVVVGSLRRVQRGHGYAFSAGPPAGDTEPVREPARVAVMLALAHKIQLAIDRGAVRDRAEAARRLGLTRARISQLLDLTLLAPDIQEAVLAMEAVGGIEPVAAQRLQTLTGHEAWPEQRVWWRLLAGEMLPPRYRGAGADLTHSHLS